MALSLDVPFGATGVVAKLHRITHVHVYFTTKMTEIGHGGYLNENQAEPIVGETITIADIPPSGADLVSWCEEQLKLQVVGKDSNGDDVKGKFADAVVVTAKPLPEPVKLDAQAAGVKP